MKFEVIKELTWDGKTYQGGDTIEIADDNPKIGSLTRAKFIRVRPPSSPEPLKESKPRKEKPVEKPVTEEEPVKETTRKDPKQIVREAKAKADNK